VSLALRWNDDVPADLRRVRERFGEAAFAQARQVTSSLPGDPLLGDWLTDHPGTGHLSACRKVKLGPDEITTDLAAISCTTVPTHRPANSRSMRAA
jgi:hypothetical protein